MGFPFDLYGKIMQIDGFLEYLFLQYEKPASILSSHDPPIVLAKVDLLCLVQDGLIYIFKMLI